ncbi:hypothetical protein VTP01DRAFT_5463 [Rhizomucor pusillus]|uniref:uncharacterized protein n=1 Tax=Rhizomucor pusillus TaxID=4840 RepID=UPI003742A745
MSLQSLSTILRTQSAKRIATIPLRRLTMSAVVRDFENARKQDAEVTPAQEERHITPAEAISGAPEELTTERSVRIFQPAKTATQSGKQGTRHWRIDFEILEDGDRWENPLIGWASSSDYQQGLQMKFKTKEDAIRFAERQGWSYYVQEQKTPKFQRKMYADNYKYSPDKLRYIMTK